MNFSTAGVLLLISLTAPACLLALVAIVALRGTQPHDRPEILRALAVFAQATVRGSTSLRRRSRPSRD